MYFALGTVDVTICVPQFEIQPLEPGAAVPGAPVLELDGTQKSFVVPHWPQILQHALSAHVFNVVKSVPAGALVVFGRWGPQTALGTGAGIGGYPVLKHIL